MLYNNLGKSDLKISEIGLGCMSLRGGYSLEHEKVIRGAMDLGVNYFDTADFYDYGDNEVLLGKVLKNSQRENIVLATKVGNRWLPDKSGWSWDVSASYINQAVDNSLQRLNTDYIDLYQIHGGTIEDDFEEVVATLENLVQLGKIRAYGISSIRPNVFERFALQSNIASNMMQFSLLDTRPIAYEKLFEEQQISVIARGVFAQGYLLTKETEKYLNHTTADVAYIKKIVDDISIKYDISKECVALAYLLRHQTVSSAIIGVSKLEQLEALRIASAELQAVEIDFVNYNLPILSYQEHLS